MSVINSDSVRAGASGAVSGYTIDQSCRFNDNDSAQTVKTFDSTARTNDKICTYSTWVKRGNLGSEMALFGNAGNLGFAFFDANDKLNFQVYDGGIRASFITTQVFRDPSAWFHVLIVYDSTPSTPGSSDIQIWINGVQVTAFDTETYSAQNQDSQMFAPSEQVFIGANTGGSRDFDGYFAETVFIDGTKYTSTNFGEFDSNGNWVPIDVSDLTFGQNGFWLDYAIAPGTGNGAGNDVSGNNNDFTDTGLAANDQVTDSPSDDADNDVGNYCVLNSISKQSSVTLSNGNLGHIAASGGSTSTSFGTIAMTEGKWYMEMENADTSNNWGFGVVNSEFVFADGIPVGSSNGWFNMFESTTVLRNYEEGTSGGNHTTGITAVIADRICLAIDADNNKMWGGIVDATDNVTRWMDGGTTMTGDPGAGSNESFTIDSPPYHFAVGTRDIQAQVNFGQQAFLGTIPSGFKRLCTANLSAPAITDPSDGFAVDYQQEGTIESTIATARSGWDDYIEIFKNRDANEQWIVRFSHDTSNEYVFAPTSPGQTATATYQAKSTLSGTALWMGFTARTSSAYGAKSAAVAHTNGSDTTVTHDLGTTNHCVFLFQTNSSKPIVFHHPALSSGKLLDLGGRAAEATSSTIKEIGANSFKIDTGEATDTYDYWVFSDIKGLCSLSSYVGNANADGPVLNLGLSPDVTYHNEFGASRDSVWFDAARQSGNPFENELWGGTYYGAENQIGALPIDSLAGGLKIRGTSNSYNGSATYLNIAWGRAFGGSGVAQARAR